MILLFIDSKFRDGKSYINIAKQLNEQDIPVLLTSFDNWQEAIRLNPNVVVLNHLIGNRNLQIAKYVQSYGGKVVILPTEGRPNNDEIARWWKSEQGDAYDLFLHWNDLFTESDNRHVVTGCPRFDIYPNKQHKTKEQACALLGLNLNKKIVTIASSFPQAKFGYTHSSFNHTDWKDLNRGDTVQNVQNELNEFHIFVNIMDIVAKLKSEWQFIIKPHPMEPSWMWESFCEKNPNCKLVTQLPIEDILAASDVLVNRAGCITFHDGVLAGVNDVYTLNLTDRILDGAEEESFTVSRWSGSPDIFIRDFCFEYDDRSVVMRYAQEVVNKHLNHIGDATGLVCEELSKLYDQSESPGCSFDMLLRFQSKRSNTNMANAYPDIDTLHTGKTITDGSIMNYWMNEFMEAGENG